MRILIVDDNESIQEILSEILSVDGYETVTASSIDAAAEITEKSIPDAILLESSVGGRNGLDLIDMMTAKGRRLSNVILLTSAGETVPKDNPSIAGSIQKPFESTAVLGKMKDIFGGNTKEKPKRSRLKGLFGKKAEIQDEVPVVFGKSCMFIENEPDHAYKAVYQLSCQGRGVMLITSGRIKAARERVGSDNAKVIGLSIKGGEGYIGPEMLGSVMAAMSSFIAENSMPVIMLDDLDLLIERNGANAVLTMMHQIVNDSGKLLTIIVSSRSGEMTEKDRELLHKSMDIRTFGE